MVNEPYGLMITRETALRELENFSSDIRRLYSKPVADYRGRPVDAESVLAYLKSEKERFAEIASLLPPAPRARARLLDVGIAYGFLPALLKGHGWDCEGLELAENIPVYCALAQELQIKVHPGKLGLAPLPFEDGSFDLLLFSEVLEHLRLSPSLVFAELKRILAPGGMLLVTTPNFARITNVVKLFLGKNPLEAFPSDVRSENITECLTHIREYTMGELCELVGSAGLKMSMKRFSSCMERHRAHSRIGGLVPPWRGDLMVLATKPGATE